MKNKTTFVIGLMMVAFVNPALAITGGEPLSADIAPYVVNIKMENGMCSGTVISANTVLTAAHCADRSGAPQVVAYITAGKTKPCDVSNVIDMAYEPSALPILPFQVHAPDILLLKLDKPLCGTKQAAIQKTVLQPGDVLFAAGQGEGNKVFGQAEKTSLKIIESDQAASQVSPLKDPVAKDLLRLGAKTYVFALPVLANTSFCSGDSGGPVFRENGGEMQIYGVNGAVLPNETLGAAFCDDAYLQILTPVAPYYDWIESKILEWKN